MAKFIYRMQNILNLKLKLEEQEKTAFAMAAARLNQEETKLEELFEKKERLETEYKECMSKVDIPSLKMLSSGRDKVDSDIKSQKINVSLAQKNLDVARVRLEEAITERKIQEKLREKALEEFKVELAAAESKEVDQLVSYNFSVKEDEIKE